MISFDQVALGIKIIFFFANIVFRAEFYNKCQNLPGHAVSQLLKFLTHNLCEYGSRVGIRVKKVIISNLVISLVPYFSYYHKIQSWICLQHCFRSKTRRFWLIQSKKLGRARSGFALFELDSLFSECIWSYKSQYFQWNWGCRLWLQVSMTSVVEFSSFVPCIFKFS